MDRDTIIKCEFVNIHVCVHVCLLQNGAGKGGGGHIEKKNLIPQRRMSAHNHSWVCTSSAQ